MGVLSKLKASESLVHENSCNSSKIYRHTYDENALQNTSTSISTDLDVHCPVSVLDLFLNAR